MEDSPSPGQENTIRSKYVMRCLRLTNSWSNRVHFRRGNSRMMMPISWIRVCNGTVDNSLRVMDMAFSASVDKTVRRQSAANGARYKFGRSGNKLSAIRMHNLWWSLHDYLVQKQSQAHPWPRKAQRSYYAQDNEIRPDHTGGHTRSEGLGIRCRYNLKIGRKSEE